MTYGKAFTGQTGGSSTVEDRVLVPDVAAGEYVLRWRWCVTGSCARGRSHASADLSRCCVHRDCEASSQIWTTCSDITIA
jgi:hypothetical protein